MSIFEIEKLKFVYACFLILDMLTMKIVRVIKANVTDPDQTASFEAACSESSLYVRPILS